MWWSYREQQSVTGLSPALGFRLAGAALALILLAGCEGSEGRVHEYLARGKDHLAAGLLEKARVDFKTVLQLDPVNVEGIHHLGRVMEASDGGLRKAFKLYSRALDQDPEHLPSLVRLARIHLS